MLIAVSGPWGRGKTSACEVLARRGYTVIDLEEVARRDGFVTGRDPVRQTDEVDVEALRDGLNVPAKIAFLRSHFAHRMRVNVAIVLRCRPSVLRQRLEARGWGPEKVHENVEAEAIDVILQEAVANLPFVYEVDTTDVTPPETANRIMAILQGQTKGHEPGSVDWTSEVLSWY